MNYVVYVLTKNGDWMVNRSICSDDRLTRKQYFVIAMFLRSNMPIPLF
jgi:hypothetical protein